jgi:MscS family membrane protein
MKECRVIFTLKIVYKTSHKVLAEIPAILQNVMEREKDTRFDKAIYSRLETFGVDFEVGYYIVSADYNHYIGIQQKINHGIRQEFDKRRIQFAIPPHQVRLDQLKNLKNDHAKNKNIKLLSMLN